MDLMDQDRKYLKVYSYTAFKISQCGRVQVNIIL